MNDDKELSHQEKRGVLRNLISVMVADCKIDPAEMQFLEQIRQKMGITREELNEIFSNIGTIEEFIPEDPQIRIAQLLDMVFMMVVDGHIDKREVEVCALMAKRFGLDLSVIDTIVDSIGQGKKREEINKILQISI